MTDILGHRLKLGILVPSTNSSVQPEMDDLRPAGVTNHVSRIAVPNQSFHTDADAEAIVEATYDDLMPAIDRVMSCNPDKLIMAMAVPCFWDGVEAGEKLKARLQERAGVPVLTPPDALHAALKSLGAKRIAGISPYMPLADQHVANWFTEQGYDVAEIRGLKAATEDSVVDLSPEKQSAAFTELAAMNVDALLQVGTSMASSRLVAEFEQRFATPVVSVNNACMWHALRSSGIADRISGYGRLLEEF